MGTLSEELAAYLTRMRYEDLPQPVVDKAKLCILDSLGVLLAGLGEPVSRTVAKHAVRRGAPGPCTVFGRTERLCPEYASLANGTAAHVLDWDDSHRPAGDHIGSVAVPAAFTMAEATNASGRDLVLAVVLGYDAMGRVGESVALPRGQGRLQHGKIMIFGTVAAAGKLLGLDLEAMTSALGIAGDAASGLREFRPTGTDLKGIHVGRAAQAGIDAAYLASAGVSGSRTIFEGPKGFCVTASAEPRPEMICRDLGTRFAVIESVFKRFPCVQNLHLPISAALELRHTHEIDPGTVRRLRIGLSEWAYRDYSGNKFGRQRPPKTVGNARFSMSFAVAVALHDGELGQRQFTDAKLKDPGVMGLEQKVEFFVDPEVEAVFSAQDPKEPYFFSPCSLSVETSNGTFGKAVLAPPGYDAVNHRPLPPDPAEVIQKFHTIADHLITRPHADRAIEWILGIERQSDVSAVAEVLGSVRA